MTPNSLKRKALKLFTHPFINDVGTESMVEICKKRGSHGILQTTWHKPQTAVPSVILSGALQWCGKKPSDELKKNFAAKWYK